MRSATPPTCTDSNSVSPEDMGTGTLDLHGFCMLMFSILILSEWIAEELRLVPSSVSPEIRGLLASPIYPSPFILVRKE